MSSKLLYRAILALIIAFHLPFLGWSQTAYLPHYTTKNGLPSNNCYYILEDKKGYIWVATDAGVSRFDGTTFENFSVDDGLPDNQILQLREDSKGRIWFLSLNGQLSYFYNGKIHHPENDRQLKGLNFNAVVVSFFEDSKGRIWFGTNENIIGVWDGNSLIKYSSPITERQYANAFIKEDKQGNIWAYSTTAAFLYIKSNFVLIDDQVLPLSYKTSANRKDKSTYLLSKLGLYVKTGPISQLVLKIRPDLLSNRPGYIFVDKKQLWLSNNSGVYVLGFNGKETHLLKDIDVNQVVRDRSQNMWFTTKNGIYRLPDPSERVYVFNKEHGLTINQISSLTKDNHNRLWMGGENQLNIMPIAKKKVEQIVIPDKRKYNVIKQLVLDEKNDQIYFSSDYGVGVIPSTSPRLQKIRYLKEKNNSVFVVKNFTIDTGHKMALALSSGVVILNDRIKNFEFSSSNYKEKEDYFTDRSYSVYYDSSQHLWFSNVYGLSEFDGQNLNKHYQKSSLLTKRINDIKRLPNGILALATDGYGMLFLDKDRIFKQLTQRDGLNNNIINRLYIKNNSIWAISNTGVNRIEFVDKQFRINSFDYANDLLSDDLNDIYIDNDTAYFATNNGLVYFAHSQKKFNAVPPRVFVSSIINNGQLLDLGATSFVLNPDKRNIIFNYSAIDFKSRRIVYRYRLKEDENWTETRNRRLELSSLQPGKYCFEVCARSQDGKWSKPAQIRFVMGRHFWQTWWFLSIILAIGAYILYRITVYITKRQKNKEQEQLLLKNKILMLEQQALQAMMNPHFVFNVMNSIQHYINTQNTSSANKVLTGFAKLIRKNLEICTKSYVNLEEEIEYLNLYLKLEKNRFGDKLKYQINIGDKIDREETLVPSMLLQPYIENAIWHGIMPKEEGGEITINIDQKDEEYLWIMIIDDGVGIQNSLAEKNTGHQSKGMSLTKERINLLNKIEPKPIQLFIQQNGENGTTITLLVPLN